MQIKTAALIIKTMDVGDNDRLLTLLTKELGVIKAFASGAKKLKSRFYASTGFLCYSDFFIEEKKNTYRVRECALIKSFFKIGCDIEQLSLEQYFCELADVLAPRDTDSESYFRLMLNALHFLNNKKMSQTLIKPVVELRMLCMSGYMPDLVACEGCGKFDDDIMYFNSHNGALYCEACKQSGFLTTIDRTLLSALRHIVYADFEKLFSFSVPQEHALMLSQITEKYLLCQTEHRFKTLDFYNSVVGV